MSLVLSLLYGAHTYISSHIDMLRVANDHIKGLFGTAPPTLLVEQLNKKLEFLE